MPDHHSSLTWGALAMTLPPGGPPQQPDWNRATTPLRLIVSPTSDDPVLGPADPSDPFGAPLLQDAHDDETTRATTVLTFHTGNAAGLCNGCQRLYGQLKPYPCEPARWAHAVLRQRPDAAAETP